MIEVSNWPLSFGVRYLDEKIHGLHFVFIFSVMPNRAGGLWELPRPFLNNDHIPGLGIVVLRSAEAYEEDIMHQDRP